jgi:hypothetical protein
MSYIGNNLQVAYPSYRVIDDISSGFNGVLKTFALRVAGSTPIPFPINPQQCLLSVNNIVQKPDSTGASGFTLTGSNIVFATAPTAGWSFFGTVLAGADYVNVGANFPSGTAAVPSVTFDESTGTGLFLASSNVLGIATSGVQQLTVDSSGNVSVTGGIASALGTAVAPAYRFTGDPNTGIYSPGADQVAISTGGTRRLVVDANGNIAFGSGTVPQYSFLLNKNITGNTNSYGTVSQGTIQSDVTTVAGYFVTSSITQAATFTLTDLHHYRATQGTFGADSTVTNQYGFSVASSLSGATNNYGFYSGIAFDTGRWGFYAAGTADSYFASNNFIWANGGSEKARIDSSGRLLVGTSTVIANKSYLNGAINPQFEIDGTGVANATVALTNWSSAASSPAHVVLSKSKSGTVGTRTLVANNDDIGVIVFTADDGTNFIPAAAILAEVDGTPGANNMPGRLVFSTTADGAATSTERMRIQSDGKLLVGTSDATGVLGTGVKIKSNAVGSAYNTGALVLEGTAGDFYALSFGASSDIGILSVSSGAVDYISIAGSAANTKFYSNGLVQMPNVGTTASAANVFMDSARDNQLARSTSSVRYKTNIEDLDTDRADAALSLRPIWYRSKAIADRKDWSHYGLIAEEVAEIEPRLVNWTYLEDDYITVTNKYGIENKELKPNAKLVPDGVQYERLSVLLLSVVQRQEKRIEQLEVDIATIKNQLA